MLPDDLAVLKMSNQSKLPEKRIILNRFILESRPDKNLLHLWKSATSDGAAPGSDTWSFL